MICETILVQMLANLLSSSTISCYFQSLSKRANITMLKVKAVQSNYYYKLLKT